MFQFLIKIPQLFGFFLTKQNGLQSASGHIEDSNSDNENDILPEMEANPPSLLLSGGAESNAAADPFPAMKDILNAIKAQISAYVANNWSNANEAFETEIVAIKEENDVDEASLVDKPENTAVIDLISAAYPPADSEARRDQSAIDVMMAYNNKPRVNRRALYKSSEIFAGISGLLTNAKHIQQEGDKSNQEAVQEYKAMYYQQALELHQKLLVHPSHAIKGLSKELADAIRATFPDQGIYDLPQREAHPRKCRT